MDTLPPHLWRDVRDLTPELNFVAWSCASADVAAALQPLIPQTWLPKFALGQLSFLRHTWHASSPSIVPIVFHKLLLWAAKGGHMHALSFLKEWKMRVGCKAHRNPRCYCGRNSCFLGSARCASSETLPQDYTKFDDAFKDAMTAAAPHVDALKVLLQWAREVSGKELALCCANEGDIPVLDIAQHAAACGNVATLQCLKDLGMKWATLEVESGLLTPFPTNDALRLAVKGGHLSVLKFCKRWAQEEALRKQSSQKRQSVSQKEPFILRVVRRNLLVCHAIMHNQVDVVRLFRKWGLRVDDLRPYSSSALAEATRRNRLDMWVMFKSWQDSDGEDRLSIKDLGHDDNYLVNVAASCGHMDMLKFFREWRDPNGERLRLNSVRWDLGDINSGWNKTLGFIREWVAELNTPDVRHPRVT